jgi:hypothetical protein
MDGGRGQKEECGRRVGASEKCRIWRIDDTGSVPSTSAAAAAMAAVAAAASMSASCGSVTTCGTKETDI